jgi:small ligand-binding sensory domain FIST
MVPAASALIVESDSTVTSPATAAAAATAACQSIRDQLGDSQPPRDGQVGDSSVAFLFTCGEFNDHFANIVETIRGELAVGHIVGCTAESVLGTGREVEGAPAISLLLMKTEQPFYPLRLEFVPGDGGSIVGWPDDWLADWPADVQIILLGDPFSFPVDLLLEQANDQHPGVQLFGGMASGAARPGDNCLAYGDEIFSEGAVGVAFLGSPWRPVLSQGCRPIGPTFVVTKVEGNSILELGGLPAYDQLMTVYEQLPNLEKALAQRGLHLGRVVSEYLEEFSAGDFLVRNVIGANSEDASVAVGDYLRVGQTVQFHLRDADSADLDWKRQLASVSVVDRPAAAALLFTCNGRGRRLFADENHDAAAVQAELGDIPIAGFFAQGEIGPVGGANFLHGFTASMVFLPAAK